MWVNPKLSVAWVVLVLSSRMGPVSGNQDMQSEKTCAMEEAMVAMKELLVLLSGEVRELRKQVGKSCGVGGGRGNDEGDEMDEPGSDPDQTQGEVEDDDTDETPTGPLTTALPTTTTEEYDYTDFDDNQTNPIDNVVSGLQDWWGEFNIFDPKPTTQAPDEDLDEDDPFPDPFGTDDDDRDPFGTGDSDTFPDPYGTGDSDPFRDPFGTDDDDDRDPFGTGDEDDDPVVRPQRPTYRPPRPTTTSTTTIRPDLPPVPSYCPDPFRLLAESCYLILHDQRDWRTWGESDGLCQSYGGALAAPWRVASLRDFLSSYYSDAFWVGAKLDSGTRRWEWLSGRPMESEEWKPGQPDRNPGKRCIRLDKWSGYHASNFFCGEKLPFVCEARQA